MLLPGKKKKKCGMLLPRILEAPRFPPPIEFLPIRRKFWGSFFFPFFFQAGGESPFLEIHPRISPNLVFFWGGGKSPRCLWPRRFFCKPAPALSPPSCNLPTRSLSTIGPGTLRPPPITSLFFLSLSPNWPLPLTPHPQSQMIEKPRAVPGNNPSTRSKSPR